jgi:hypothetical protein
MLGAAQVVLLGASATGEGQAQPPVGPLEPIDDSAGQIAISVGSSPRQTWIGAGWGCDGISQAPAAAPLVDAHDAQLFTELNTKVIRVHNPQATNFVSAYKPISDIALSRGVDTILATGYVAAADSTPTALADAIDAAIVAGIPITDCSLQNEPDGNPNNQMPNGDIVPWHAELRSRLDALGRQSVRIIAIEWAHFPNGSTSRGSVEFDLLHAAGLAGPDNAVHAGSGHCYRDCPAPAGYDARWLTVGSGLWSCETGNAGSPNAQARFAAALNHGAAVEIFHIGQSNSPGDGDLSQKLVRHDGTRQPYQPAYGVISRALQRGTVFRLCTCDDRPAGLPVTTADRMVRDGSSQLNPRVQVAAGRRSNGRWSIVAVNATQGAADSPSSFLGGAYKAATLQLTVTVAELAGLDRTFAAERASSSGSLSGPSTVNLQNGVTRFTLAAGETISLVENPVA